MPVLDPYQGIFNKTHTLTRPTRCKAMQFQAFRCIGVTGGSVGGSSSGGRLSERIAIGSSQLPLQLWPWVQSTRSNECTPVQLQQAQTRRVA